MSQPHHTGEKTGVGERKELLAPFCLNCASTAMKAIYLVKEKGSLQYSVAFWTEVQSLLLFRLYYPLLSDSYSLGILHTSI